MQQPVKLNYRIYEGSTFQETYRWESQTKVYIPISAISQSAPCVITTQTAHNLPAGWRFRVVGAGGMKDINSSQDNYYLATATPTTTTIEINSVNSLQYAAYTTGGVVEYNQPVDLAGYTARMQVRPSVESSTVIHEATTQNGGILIDQTLKTIMIQIPATTTEQFDFETAVYSVELVSSTNIVTPFLTGNLVLVREVTR